MISSVESFISKPIDNAVVIVFWRKVTVRLFCRWPTPSEACRLVLSRQQKFVASPQVLVLPRREERTFALHARSRQRETSLTFLHCDHLQ